VRALFSLAAGGQASCGEARALAAAHLQDVKARIADLKRMQRVLADAVRACDAGDNAGCPLIDSL
jgi:MerR family mercuric resistance operon transcriptional regulator